MHDTTKSKSTKKRYSSSNNFYVKKSCLEIQKRAFSRVGAKICSEIRASLREPPPPPPPPKKTLQNETPLFRILVSCFRKYIYIFFKLSYESVGRKKAIIPLRVLIWRDNSEWSPNQFLTPDRQGLTWVPHRYSEGLRDTYVKTWNSWLTVKTWIKF